jgi:hypothetical protein
MSNRQRKSVGKMYNAFILKKVVPIFASVI